MNLHRAPRRSSARIATRGSRQRKAIALALAATFAVAGSLTVKAPTAAAQPARDAATEAPADPRVATADMEARLRAIEADTELDDGERQQLTELYTKARDELGRAKEFTAEADRLAALIQSGATDLDRAQQDATAEPSTYDFDAIEAETDLSRLTEDLRILEQQQELATKALADAQLEPQRRAERLAKIPTELADAERTAGEIADSLAAAKEDDSPLNVAAGTLLRARRQAVEERIRALKNEKEAYEILGSDFLQLRIEAATRRARQLSEDVKRLTAIVAERRKTDARSQLQDAEAAKDLVEPPHRKEIGRLVEFATERLEQAAKLKSAGQQLHATQTRLRSLSADLEQTEKRLDQGASSEIGMLLVRKRTELPSRFVLLRNLAVRRQELARSQTRLFELQDRRSALTNRGITPAWRLAELRDDAAASDETGIQQRIDQSEAVLLDDLIRESASYVDQLVRTNSAESDLIETSVTFQQVIDTNAFWVRSAPALSLQEFKEVLPAIGWLFRGEAWVAAATSLGKDARQNPLLYSAFGALIGGLAIYRSTFKRKIVALGETARKRSCREFSPTVQVLLLTIAISAPGPLLIYFVGWRLGFSSSVFAHALAASLLDLAIYYLALELMRQSYRPHGLAEAHFDRSDRFTKSMRLAFKSIIFLLLPLIFVAHILRWQPEPSLSSSLGRLCFIAAVVVLAVTSRSIFRRADVSASNATMDIGLLGQGRLSGAVQLLIVASSCITLLLAVTGYYFTAWSLLQLLFNAVVLLFVLHYVSLILTRWVRIERRGLAYAQAKERRARERDARKDAGGLDDIVIDDDEIDVKQVDDQSRRLIRGLMLILGIVGMLWVIRDLLPTLAILDSARLWEKPGVDGATAWVTVSDLLLATILLVATASVGKNLPGLLEMLVFKRMRLEPSVRYAVGQLSTYAAVAIGLIAGCNMLGLTWNKVQWLVAALGVGLGFGLQEIFANFVSGIILLFERPIRVGDVITLGDTTGVVTRIQIRATTIRSWDRQDLVVPNRDLITGKLLNWTLSGTLNRITFGVGVAYDSDVRRVRGLLLKTLAENPRVLDQPPPLVTFEEFGDSALNFVVRAFLPTVDDRLSTLNELHTAIHETFAEAGIEMPFPQRDLHIRTTGNGHNFARSDVSVAE